MSADEHYRQRTTTLSLQSARLERASTMTHDLPKMRPPPPQLAQPIDVRKVAIEFLLKLVGSTIRAKIERRRRRKG